MAKSETDPLPNPESPSTTGLLAKSAAGVRDVLSLVRVFSQTLIRVPWGLARSGSLSSLESLHSQGQIPDASLFFVLSAICAAFAASAAPEVKTVPGLLAHLSTQSLSAYVGSTLVAFSAAYAVASIFGPLLAKFVGCSANAAREAGLYVAGCAGLVLAIAPILHLTIWILLWTTTPVESSIDVGPWRTIEWTVNLVVFSYVGASALAFARASLLDYRRTEAASRRLLPTALVGLLALVIIAGLCTALLGGVVMLDRYQQALAVREYGRHAFTEARLIRCTLTDSVQCTFFAETSASVLVFPECIIRPVSPDWGWMETPILADRRLQGKLSRADKTSLAGLLPFQGTQLFVVDVSVVDVCEQMAWADLRGPVTNNMALGPFGWKVEATVSHTQSAILFPSEGSYKFRRSYEPPTGVVTFVLYGIEQTLNATQPALGQRCRTLRNSAESETK